MNPVLRTSAAHVFVESAQHPTPSDEDAHHLFRVLRLRDGETVTVADGVGNWRPTVVRGSSLEPSGEVVTEPATHPCLIAAAVPKGDRLEWMLQKLTEVGATRIVLLHTARGVVRWDPVRSARQVERLGRVVRDAASQSRRTWLPVLEGPLPLAEVLAWQGAVLADPDGEPLSVGAPVNGPLVIGPEGGFDPPELDAAARHGVRRVSFGATVLRVETAAVVAATLVTAMSGRASGDAE